MVFDQDASSRLVSSFQNMTPHCPLFDDRYMLHTYKCRPTQLHPWWSSLCLPKLPNTVAPSVRILLSCLMYISFSKDRQPEPKRFEVWHRWRFAAGFYRFLYSVSDLLPVQLFDDFIRCHRRDARVSTAILYKVRIIFVLSPLELSPFLLDVLRHMYDSVFIGKYFH